jgi:uncharacterized membrane protein
VNNYLLLLACRQFRFYRKKRNLLTSLMSLRPSNRLFAPYFILMPLDIKETIKTSSRLSLNQFKRSLTRQMSRVTNTKLLFIYLFIRKLQKVSLKTS